MERRLDWMMRLEEYVQRTRHRPFMWGENDCAMWVAGAIRAMTDTDLAENYRGLYASKSEGVRLARGDHVDVIATMLPEIPVGHAGAGDVVVIEGATLGIVQGRFAWAMTDSGLGWVPMQHAMRAFRV